MVSVEWQEENSIKLVIPAPSDFLSDFKDNLIASGERNEDKMLLEWMRTGGLGSGPDVEKQMRNLEQKIYGAPMGYPIKGV